MGLFKKREPEPYKEPEVTIAATNRYHDLQCLHTFFMHAKEPTTNDVAQKFVVLSDGKTYWQADYYSRFLTLEQFRWCVQNGKGVFEIGSFRIKIANALVLKGFAHGEKWYKENHKT
jgi:hypothetical protein